MKRTTKVRAVNPQDKSKSSLRNTRKTGRNEKCPCGSGKKFKHCHLER